MHFFAIVCATIVAFVAGVQELKRNDGSVCYVAEANLGKQIHQRGPLADFVLKATKACKVKVADCALKSKLEEPACVAIFEKLADEMKKWKEEGIVEEIEDVAEDGAPVLCARYLKEPPQGMFQLANSVDVWNACDIRLVACAEKAAWDEPSCVAAVKDMPNKDEL